MELFLVLMAISGRFLLVWRRKSLSGYFGFGGEPGIFTYAAGNLLVLALGHLLLWMSLLSLASSGSWLLAGLAFILAFSLANPIFYLLHRTSSPPPPPPAVPIEKSTQARPTPQRLKYGLDELRTGISVDRSIELLLNACNKPDTMFITDRWIEPRLQVLRTHLAEPVTATQADALLEAIFERAPFNDVLDWLQTSNLPWPEYRSQQAQLKDQAKRERAERIRKQWENVDWEELKRLRDAGHHVYIPPEVLFKRKPGGDE